MTPAPLMSIDLDRTYPAPLAPPLFVPATVMIPSLARGLRTQSR